MPAMHSLGEMIKFLRNRRGWMQKELAKRAGLTKGMVSGYETGKKTPTLQSLTRIAEALQADFCDLHCAFEHVQGRPMVVHELTAHFRPGPARPSAAAPLQAPASSVGGAGEPAPAAAAGDAVRDLEDFTVALKKVLVHFLPGR
ncbi:MAG TPA: helix-turn-helix transcriptional regulator [Thermoanaerobaculia bacterium]|nr:helix-turn-helix transcriptional regulator [Thermoanaerobaculia bacterium]